MSNSFKSLLSDQVIALEWGTALKDVLCLIFWKKHYFKWEKIFLLIFIWNFIFFAERSCDNFKNDVVLLIAPLIIVKYFRKNVFKNKLTRVYVSCLYFLSLSHNYEWTGLGFFVQRLINFWRLR